MRINVLLDYFYTGMGNSYILYFNNNEHFKHNNVTTR